MGEEETRWTKVRQREMRWKWWEELGEWECRWDNEWVWENLCEKDREGVKIVRNQAKARKS